MTGIRAMRERAGLTQQALADHLGVQQSAVAMYERGSALPTADKLPAMAKILGCSIDDLYGPEWKEATDDGTPFV